MKSVYSQPENSKLAVFIRASIGLPYVPLNRINEGVKLLQELAKELKGKQYDFGQKFVSYMMTTWINGNFEPSTWNFYAHRGITTNNNNEAYNYRIGHRKALGHAVHPNPYLLISVLKDELQNGIDDCLAAAIGNPNLKTFRSRINVIDRKKNLMKNLHEHDTDLCTYMKAMGVLCLSLIHISEPTRPY